MILRLLHTLYILLVSVFAMGQISLSNQIFPFPGDSIYFFVDELPEISITSPGPNQQWNYAGLQAPYLQYRLVEPASSGRNYDLYPSSDILIRSMDGSEEYFEIKTGRLDIVGGSGSIFFDYFVPNSWFMENGLPAQLGPVDYNDEKSYESKYKTTMPTRILPSEILSYFPDNTDSIQIESVITRHTKADAWGELFTPGGRYDVLRIRFEDQIDADVWLKTSKGTWRKAPPELSSKLVGDSSRTSFHYFDNDYRQPVVSVFMDQTGRPSQAHYMASTMEAMYSKRPKVGQWLYAFPNPAISTVRFKFMSLLPGTYTIRFYNILGKRLIEKSYFINKNKTIEVDIGQLAKGTYLYSLLDERGKKIITKRLIVLKP